VSQFTTVSNGSEPLRVVIVGAGPMGQRWLHAVNASDRATPVGLVDLNLDAARAATHAKGMDELPVGESLTELLRTIEADAVINVTVPRAHHAVSTEAMRCGLPVLSEKPLAPTVAEGLSLAATSEITGQLLMVSQSRRYYRAITQLRNVIAQLGSLGVVSTEFFRAPHFGGFRDSMEHPLLLDMAIHAFDAFRYLVGDGADDPVSVYCEEFNPAWSWFTGDAGVSANFITRSGARFVYTGSWCSPGMETSWNGQWRISAEHGTALWDGENAPTWDSELALSDTDSGQIPEEIAGSLEEFISALRTGETPSGSARSNLRSLAMVEGAIESSRTGARVSLSEIIVRALEQAIDDERTAEVAQVLGGWSVDEI
jgi:predicted dehydrogenase